MYGTWIAYMCKVSKGLSTSVLLSEDVTLLPYFNTLVGIVGEVQVICYFTPYVSWDAKWLQGREKKGWSGDKRKHCRQKQACIRCTQCHDSITPMLLILSSQLPTAMQTHKKDTTPLSCCFVNHTDSVHPSMQFTYYCTSSPTIAKKQIEQFTAT